MGEYENYIHKSRYARWLEKKGRRENWEETVDRYLDFFSDKLDAETRTYLRTALLDQDAVPSMRAVMTAGEALQRDNVAGFNCSYLPIDDVRSFDEMMYILMCGTGVGFSVERQYICKLPEVPSELVVIDKVLKVEDHKIGWATSFQDLVASLYQGKIPSWDVSSIRPKGAKLKVMGGRASGPAPLVDLFNYTVDLFKEAAGRKLNSIECHLLCCKIADIVVVGGVRRSALIGLSNLTDGRISRAKHGNWWEVHPELRLANNSACYTERPDFESFLGEWHDLYKSKSGERGLFSRPACKIKASENGRRDPDHEFGTNPCSEIILRPYQFCNLSEAIIRSTDSLADIKRKVKVSSILGTLQATLTDFRYLRPIWKKNTEEEALLGVSLTGVMDHPILSGKTHYASMPTLGDKLTLGMILKDLKQVAIDTNKIWAEKLGIKQAAAITCIKPSGTVSQLTNTSSGIHPRYSEYYIRRVRSDIKDPLAQMMLDQGVPCEVDVMNPNNLVFSFPQKAPETSVKEGDYTSLEFLDLIECYNINWCEHKVSATVHYKKDEFLGIGQWIWDQFDNMSGVSFLPYDGHTYQQAPYEAITKEEYEELMKIPIVIDWEALYSYEMEDHTTGTQTLACTGATCEV